MPSVVKPVLVVIAGPNGSGKTEIAKILRSNYDWTEGLTEVNPDNIAQQEFGNWNDPEAVLKGARRADEIREECLAKRQGLIFETVLSIPEKVDYIQRTKDAGYFIRMVYVATESPEINMVRVAWRADQGGHTVPVEKIRSRYQRSLQQAIAAARIVDRAYFVDNSRDVENPTDEISPFPVFRTVDGVVARIYVKEEEMPKWTKEIYEALQRDLKG